MKKAILLIVLSLFSTISFSQIKQDSKGNYYKVSTPTTKRDTINTNKTFTDTRGNTYPVYQTHTGKLYIPRVSKNGNYYRKYLKLEENGSK